MMRIDPQDGGLDDWFVPASDGYPDDWFVPASGAPGTAQPAPGPQPGAAKSRARHPAGTAPGSARGRFVIHPGVQVGDAAPDLP